MFAKSKRVLVVWLFLFIAVPANAALLMPAQVGQRFDYLRTDSTGYSWTVEATVLDEVVRGSETYFQWRVWNYEDDGQLEDHYFRSTEFKLYVWGAAAEEVHFQIDVPVGTTWSIGDNEYERMENESVNVPYFGQGTYYDAYVFRHHDAVSSSPYCWTYLVPDIGFVKEVDYWTSQNAPKIQELTNISIIPIPGAVWLLGSGLIGLAALRKKLKK